MVHHLRGRLDQLADSNQFSIEFAERDLDIDDVVFPSKFVRFPVSSVINSNRRSVQKLSISTSTSNSRSKSPLSPFSVSIDSGYTFEPLKLGDDGQDSPHRVQPRFKRSKSFGLLSALKRRKSLSVNSQSPTTSTSSNLVQRRHSLKLSDLFPFHDDQRPSFKIRKSSKSKLCAERPVVRDFEGMTGWGQRTVVLSRTAQKVKVLAEWTFDVHGEPYTVGLLHSQKSNRYGKSTKRLIVNGEQLWAEKSTKMHFFVEPKEGLLL